MAVCAIFWKSFPSCSVLCRKKITKNLDIKPTPGPQLPSSVQDRLEILREDLGSTANVQVIETFASITGHKKNETSGRLNTN